MVERNKRSLPSFTWSIACVAIVLLTVAVSVYRSPAPAPLIETLVKSNAVPAAADEASMQANPARFATTIRRPAGPPVIELETADPQGRVGKVSCSTCHSVREPDFKNTAVELDQFHQNMQFAHGSATCYSCHHPENADALRLADGTTVEYPDVMTLCAQCHGTQARDYQHGTHGGMTGFWDLNRGPRMRNNCIDCHDPHLPKFPSMKPSFKPRDRFLNPPSEAHHE